MFDWNPYVPVAKRRKRAARAAALSKAAGKTLTPVTAGRGLIANTLRAVSALEISAAEREQILAGNAKALLKL